MPPADSSSPPASQPPPDLDFRAIFESVSGAFLILRPDAPRFTIVAASDAYLAASRTKREAIVGRGLFDVFPDPPNDPTATGTITLSASLNRAIATRRTDVMAVQRYPIRREDGSWEERHWSPANTPVLNADGVPVAVVHGVRDVTEIVRLQKTEGDLLIERDRAIERERLIAQLQEQAVELEAQSEELQATAAMLEERTEEAELARAETAAAERRLRDVVEQAPVAVAVMTGPDLVYTIASPRYVEMLGGRRFIGLPLRDALPELAGQALVEIIQRVYETGVPYAQRERLIRLDKSKRGELEDYYFNVGYQPLVNAEGRVYAVASTAYEVTDQVVARRALEEARARAERTATRLTKLQSLTAALSSTMVAESVADVVLREGLPALGADGGAVVMVRPRGDGGVADFEVLRIVGFNDSLIGAWRRYPVTAGTPGGDVVISGEPAFLGDAAGWARYPEIGKVMAAHGFEGYAGIPLLLDGKVIGLFTAAYIGPHTFTADDRLFFAAFADQCVQALERARLYADAQSARSTAEAAQHEAEEANRAKSEFLAVMSHELRTPLNAIGGYAELMQFGIHGPVTPEQLVALERIQRSQRHLLGLINGVLNYSRVEAGVVHYDIADIPLEETLGMCEALIAPQLHAKGLSLTNSGCPPGAYVRADREKLQQVVLNLLSNAVKFTPAGGRVDIECAAAPNGMMCVRVRDTGRGIAGSQIERVFQPFVQVDAGLTRTQDGVGLGLAISRDLARGMGGDLTVDSEPDVGSVFTLTVPLAGSAGRGERARFAESPTENSNALR